MLCWWIWSKQTNGQRWIRQMEVGTGPWRDKWKDWQMETYVDKQTTDTFREPSLTPVWFEFSFWVFPWPPIYNTISALTQCVAKLVSSSLSMVSSRSQVPYPPLTSPDWHRAKHTVSIQEIFIYQMNDWMNSYRWGGDGWIKGRTEEEGGREGERENKKMDKKLYK